MQNSWAPPRPTEVELLAIDLEMYITDNFQVLLRHLKFKNH